MLKITSTPRSWTYKYKWSERACSDLQMHTAWRESWGVREKWKLMLLEKWNHLRFKTRIFLFIQLTIYIYLLYIYSQCLFGRKKRHAEERINPYKMLSIQMKQESFLWSWDAHSLARVVRSTNRARQSASKEFTPSIFHDNRNDYIGGEKGITIQEKRWKVIELVFLWRGCCQLPDICLTDYMVGWTVKEMKASHTQVSISRE